MPDSPQPPAGVGHLGPAQIGQRVVVRRILPGRTGPTGGPAFTDVLGVMESWADGRTTVRRADGTVVAIRTAQIVSGKPVPPRPSRFSRFSDDEVELRAAGLFRPVAVERIGDWVLRYTGGSNARPNTILPVGDPGLPVERALDRAAGFYRRHDRRPCAQVVVGSPIQQTLAELGWVRLGPEEADTDVLLAGVAQLARALHDVDDSRVERAEGPSREWLVGNERALANYEVVAASLDLPDAAFTSIQEDGHQVARGRINAVDDWTLFADLTVQPAQRRRGLARVIMAAATRWSAERGASTMLLQVSSDNEPAQRLYAALGFQRHHTYRYLQPPEPR